MSRVHRLRLLGAAIVLASCRHTEPSEAPVVLTTVLAPPGGEGYEPTLAIDPANPDHFVAAAVNGMPLVGSSTGIWVWRTADGRFGGGARLRPRGTREGLIWTAPSVL